jgi:mRNA interferase MazF
MTGMKRKRPLTRRKSRYFFAEREIWLCRIGLNIAFEQDGKGDEFLRPVAVIRKFSRNVPWTVPLSKVRKESAYYFKFSFNPPESSFAILSQIKLIDAHRLKRKIGIMSSGEFESLKRKIRALLP